jgi:hypothetical protein
MNSITLAATEAQLRAGAASHGWNILDRYQAAARE